MITEEEVAAKYGMTPREQGILSIVSQREGGDSWRRLPKIAKRYDDFGATRKFVLDEYRAAAESCLHKGWIKVLTKADVEADRLRWANLPEREERVLPFPYKVGGVEFTALGIGVYGEILRAWCRANNLEPYKDHTCCGGDVPGQAMIQSGSREAVEKIVLKMSAGESDRWLVNGEIVTSIDPIIEIRDWWVTRFVCLPLAYSVKVFYEETEQAKEADVE